METAMRSKIEIDIAEIESIIKRPEYYNLCKEDAFAILEVLYYSYDSYIENIAFELNKKKEDQHA